MINLAPGEMKQLVLACFAARAVGATTCDVTDAVSCTVKLEKVQQAAGDGRRGEEDICAGWQAYSKCQLHVGCWAGSPEGDAFKQACVDYVRRDGPIQVVASLRLATWVPLLPRA